MKEPREVIAEEFISQFNKEGHSVSLDRVSSSLHISKKTIYKHFRSKEEIYEFLLNKSADDIYRKQREIYNNDALNTKEKLIAILTIKTPAETQIDMGKISKLETYEPAFYKKVMLSYEKRWEYFTALINQGKANGTLKKDCSATFLVGLLSSGMEMLYKEDFLHANGMTYTEAIKMLAETVLDGVFNKEDK